MHTALASRQPVTSLRLTQKRAVQVMQSAPLGAAPLAPSPGYAGGPTEQQYQQGGVPLPQWQPQQLPQQLLQQQVQSLLQNPCLSCNHRVFIYANMQRHIL